MDDLHFALRRVFSLESFRPQQEEIVKSIVSGFDTFVLLPTGGGKSLCYQVRNSNVFAIFIISVTECPCARHYHRGVSFAVLDPRPSEDVGLLALWRNPCDVLELHSEQLRQEGCLQVSFHYSSESSCRVPGSSRNRNRPVSYYT